MDVPWYKAAVVGAVAGFLSGLLGIGGGIVTVPALVLWLGVDQYRATATSVTVIVATSAAALATFGVGDAVHWSTAAVVFAGSAIGALLGAKYLERIPEWALAAVFSVVMALAAVRMWI